MAGQLATTSRDLGRRALMRLGATSSARARRRLVTLHRYLELGLWAKDRYGGLPRQRDDRFGLFEEALGYITGKAPLYLEFGVYTGGSFRWWCEHLTDPNARFVGFDSFEGLPEDWNPHVSAGAFAVDAIPEINDPRATLVAGWFEDTVPVFDVPEHDQLIVNIDSDLYSSAVLVLSQLEKFLVPGTIIYFDELSDVDHELRAWKEYLERTQAKTELLGIAGGGTNWMFRIVS